MTKRRAPIEVLERLAEAADRYVGFHNRRMLSNDGEALAKACDDYRAATAPLRTRASVDASKLHCASAYFNGNMGIETARAEWARLCSEPTADEPEATLDADGVYDWGRVPAQLWAELAHQCCADDRWHKMRPELIKAIQAVQRSAREVDHGSSSTPAAKESRDNAGVSAGPTNDEQPLYERSKCIRTDAEAHRTGDTRYCRECLSKPCRWWNGWRPDVEPLEDPEPCGCEEGDALKRELRGCRASLVSRTEEAKDACQKLMDIRTEWELFYHAKKTAAAAMTAIRALLP